MANPATSLPPGFRFHPTDEELILHYLRNRAASAPCPVSIIAEVDIYKFDPWDLPPMAKFGDREWYFFSPRDRKYPNGVRPNRAAASGYWKATGTDKPIHTGSSNVSIGVKKALVFYKGRPPKGLKTNWIMHEYRLAEAQSNSHTYRPMRLRDSSMRLDDWVLCRIYKKSNHLSADQPSMDREQEDSGSEDVHLSTSSTANTVQPKQPLDLHKSSSLSELLNLLFDNPSEILGAEPAGGAHSGAVMGHSTTNATTSNQAQFISNSSGNCNAYFYQRHSQNEQQLPAFLSDNSLKRQRPEDQGLMQPPKKLNSSCINSNFSNQFSGPQYNLLSHQPLLNQQILLDSHLRLH